MARYVCGLCEGREIGRGPREAAATDPAVLKHAEEHRFSDGLEPAAWLQVVGE